MDQEVLSDIVPRLRNICSVFRLNSFPANSPWLTYPTSSLFGAISIFVFVKMMLILSITAALIFQSGAAFCTCTSVSLMCPILPDSFTFCLQTLRNTSASLRIRVIADCRINNPICFMNAGEGVVLLWRLIQSQPREPTLLEMLVFFARHVKEMFIYP